MPTGNKSLETQDKGSLRTSLYTLRRPDIMAEAWDQNIGNYWYGPYGSSTPFVLAKPSSGLDQREDKGGVQEAGDLPDPAGVLDAASAAAGVVSRNAGFFRV